MKIFLTGGTGFIGGHFLRLALAQGHKLVAQHRRGKFLPSDQFNIRWTARPLDHLTVNDFEDCEVLVHFASPGVSPQAAEWPELLYWNVEVLVKLLATGKAAGVRRFIIAGTFAEYGRSADHYELIPPGAPLVPTNGYAASKAGGSIAATGYAIEHNLELAYLRIFSAYGVGQNESNFWPALRAAALTGSDFEMTPGGQIRDYVPVEAVAAAFLAALTNPTIRAGRPWFQNVGSGKPTTMRAFAEHWWRKWEAKGQLRVGALPYRANEVMRYVPEVIP